MRAACVRPERALPPRLQPLCAPRASAHVCGPMGPVVAKRTSRGGSRRGAPTTRPTSLRPMSRPASVPYRLPTGAAMAPAEGERPDAKNVPAATDYTSAAAGVFPASPLEMHCGRANADCRRAWARHARRTSKRARRCRGSTPRISCHSTAVGARCCRAHLWPCPAVVWGRERSATVQTSDWISLRT